MPTAAKPHKHRKLLLMLADIALFTGSYGLSWLILVRRLALLEHITAILVGYAFFIVIFYVTFRLFGMYESLWRYAEAYEFMKCILATVVAVGVYISVTLLVVRPPLAEYRLPITVYFISSMMAGMGALFFRTAYRTLRTMKASQSGKRKRKKVLLVGTGETAVAVLDSISRARHLPHEVVCIADDDAAKIGRRIHRVPVAGLVADIPRLVTRHGIQIILLAIPQYTPEEKRRVSALCAKTGCEIKKVPDILNFEANTIQMQDVRLEDLLGREEVDLRRFANKYLAGQTVLVTGAGGTIGSELCRQAAAHGATSLIMLDAVENGLYTLQQELILKYPGGEVQLHAQVCNIREEARLDELFSRYKPSLVYHAAAHKHVPLMEAAPEEAVKNNIYGTLNVARTAERHGAARFVLISSDKAVNPTNVYGVTKRVCEMIVQCLGSDSSSSATRFTAVRFGNVLGSNGSVIPLFREQIAAGGPVRVTHRDIIRYYMTVSEAVSLVMSAGEMAKGGDIFVLDMGEPVKTLEMAEMLIRLSGYEPGRDIEIEITGLRPGEKLYEELLMAEEGLTTTPNKKIFIGKPIETDAGMLFARLDEMLPLAQSSTADAQAAMLDILRGLVPAYTDV